MSVVAARPTATAQPAVEVHQLVKRYRSTVALAGLDLAVPAGSVLGLLGPNGAGKTTAVRILATLVRPDSGTAVVGGYDVVREPARVRELIGLTGQFAAVDESLTGRENLLLVGALLELGRREARRRCEDLLARFDLGEVGRRLVRTYSGGMRRRLDVAVSLLGRPSVLFLDEPTTGLDPRARGDVWDLVRAMVADGTTVLLTTQYLDEADRLATEIAVIDHGRVVRQGTPAQLKAAVGGQTLAVRAAGGAHVPTLAATVAEVVGQEPTVDGDLVTVPVVDGTAVLAALARRLHGFEVTELGVRLASLDDVFLKLTGGDR
jgi:oleandomycin transport system ATP-binding protein